MIPPPVGLGRDTKARAAARDALARVIWDDDGRRRLPRERELATALEACDPRDAWWTCEMSVHGPVYLLPTREWVRALVREVRELGARRVLEAGAGDGFLARCLRDAAPELEVIAVDDASWSEPSARMSGADRRSLKGVRPAGLTLGEGVQRADALRAVRRHLPDLVIVSWAPPGSLVERLIRSPVRHVLEIGTEGDECGRGPDTLRFACELLDGPVERRAICRLDARPSEHRATRVTLYFGRAHPDHRRRRRPPRGAPEVVEL